MSYTYIEIVSACQYPLVGKSKTSKKWETVGTCVILKLKDRFFLLTAGHVMYERKNYSDDVLWIWNHANGEKTTVNEDIISIPKESIPHGEDFAILEININEYPNINPDQAIDLSYVSLDFDSLNNSIGYLITGYPASRNNIVGNINKKPNFYLITTNADVSTDYVTAIELNYKDSMLEGEGKKLPKPQGMSGGGVWKITDKGRKLELIGLSVAYLKAEGKVIAIKISIVLSVIKHYFHNTVLDDINLPVRVELINEMGGIRVAVPV